MNDPHLARVEQARRVLEAQRRAGVLSRVLARLSPKQRAFVDDPSRRKLAVTSRQSGKTESCLALLAHGACTMPRSRWLYLAPTRQAARDILWARLREFFVANEIPCEFNDVLLEARLDNGTVISLKGASDARAARRLRGLTLDGCVVDEAAVFYDELFRELVNDIIDPALMVKDGVLALASTPGLSESGLFYQMDRSGSGSFSRHHWTTKDNPAIKNSDEYLARKRADNGWRGDEPTYRREYLGEWCQDRDAMVYRVSSDNLYESLPDGEWTHVIGVDFGYRDEAAFVVLGWRKHSQELYVVHAESESELLVDDYASRIQALISEYDPVGVVADAGALGKVIVETLRDKHGLPIDAAEKNEKPTAIRQVNAELAKRKLWLPGASQIFHQACTLRWHPDAIGRKEQDGLPNDLLDAMLYAYRKALHYLERDKPTVLTPDNPAYWLEREKQMRQNAQTTNERRDEPSPLAWEAEIDF